MGSSKHIGRIGALAVALGIGVSAGACSGVAWADDSGDSTGSVSAGPAGATDSPGTRTAKGGTGRTDEADTVETRTDGRTSTRDRQHRKARHTTATRAESRAGARDDDTSGARDDAPEPKADKTDRAEKTAPTTTDTVAKASISAVTVDVSPATEQVASAPTPVTHVRLTSLLSSLLTPGGTPETPAASPAMWVLAAAARRQTGSSQPLAAQDAVAALPVVNPPDEDGVVTGEVVVPGADAALAIPSDKGNVKVKVTGDTVSFVYTPTRQARHAAAAPGAPAEAKTDTFTLSIRDDLGTVIAVPVTVVIAPVNDIPKPTVSRPNVSLFSAEVRASVRVRDADGDPITYSVSPTAKGGTVTIDEDGHISYVPTDAARHAAAAADATDAAKTDTFDVTVSDGYGQPVTITVTVPVKPENGNPSVTVRTRPSLFSPQVTGVVRSKDPNGDPVSYSVSDSVKGGTVVIDERGRFVYTPSDEARHAAAATGASTLAKQDSFVITVTDDHGGVTKTLVTVAVKPANAAPTSASVHDVFTNPNTGVVTGAITAVDADNDALTYRFPAETRRGTVSVDENGVFTYTPSEEARAQASKPNAPSWLKADSFRVTLDDGHGGVTTLTVRVGITPLGAANQAPTDGAFTAGEPGALTGKVTGSVTATDPDRDPLSFSGSGLTAKGSVLVNADGSFTYTPTAAARHQAGADNATAADKVDTFVVTAADGYGGTLAIPVTVTIKPSVNRAPNRGSYTTATDPLTGVVSGKVKAADADGDALTYSGTADTTRGSVVVTSAGDYTYVPTDAARAAAAAAGATLADKRDSFAVTVNDGHGGTLAVTVRVTIVGSPQMVL